MRRNLLVFFGVLLLSVQAFAGSSPVLVRGPMNLSLPDRLMLARCTQVADDTTPDIGAPHAGCNVLVTSAANTVPTDITSFDNSLPGQLLFVVGGGGAIASTITDAGNFTLSMGWTGTSNNVLVLYTVAVGSFIEVTREGGPRDFGDNDIFNVGIIHLDEVHADTDDNTLTKWNAGFISDALYDDGANGLVRDCSELSASPAASDTLCDYQTHGRDSAGNWTLYANTYVTIQDATNGSEEGAVHFRVTENATFVEYEKFDGSDGVRAIVQSRNVARTIPATMAPAGVAQDIDWSLGRVQALDLGSASGNVTLTFSNVVAGEELVLQIIQAAVARSITWPATVKWAYGGLAPTLSQSNDYIDIVSCQMVSTNQYCSIVQDFR